MRLLLVLLCALIFNSCNDKKSLPKHITAYTLFNDTLKVTVKSLGAELSSIRFNDNEYLWQGDKAFWKEQSPILFPIVGKLKDDEFIHKAKAYKMKFHGFARTQEFKVINATKKSITLELKNNEVTKQQYPFQFQLQISYTIKNNTLNIGYKVINTSNKDTLYFSIGAHPGLLYPKSTSQTHNDFSLVFDRSELPKSLDKKGGLFNGETTQYFQEEGVLKLTDTTFNKGALVFNPNPFSYVSLIHNPSGKPYLKVSFDGFPYLGIWSARDKNAPFLCIEPWYGIADYHNHDKILKNKSGIQHLNPKEIFYSSYQISVLN